MRVVLIIISLLLSPTTTLAERLDLAFLPPDLPPGNVCNASPEITEDDETQEGGGGGFPELDDDERLQFLVRDIRDLTRDDADLWFDHIVALIDMRAGLDPKFSSYDVAFAKIDLHLNAGRSNSRWLRDLVKALRARLDELGSNNQVRLARFYVSGIGAVPDIDFANKVFVAQAYRGNTSALFEILSLLQRNETVEGWTLGIERTAELAFGGMVGQFNRGLCARAERMAREYLDGEYLKPNMDLAFAWRKFAADMGGAEAAWRVVEHHLNATAPVKDDGELLHYLKQAVEFGFDLGPEEIVQLQEAGVSLEAQIRNTLGHNYNHSGRDRRRSAIPYLDLQVNRFTDGITADGEYLQYLREVAALPSAPPPTITALAKEILLRNGQWKSLDQVIEILRPAADQGYAPAMMLLAELILVQREQPLQLIQAEQYYLDLVDLHGHAPAMNALDRLYRCQLPSAPMMSEAEHWAKAYRNSDTAAYSISGTDVAKISTHRQPEISAKLQSFGLQGHAISAANFLQVLQSDAVSSDQSLRYWARRVGRSDRALETFVKQEYAFAITPRERDNAVELLRRTFLDIGPSFTLDLVVALVEDSGHLPEIADEIRTLLLSAGNRGEGAAIRLLQRLEETDGQELFEHFEAVIEDRGDFLALMFAVPYVDESTFSRYMARAISVMACRTKDIAELADAYAARGHTEEAARWLRIGLTIDGRHTLSRLGLTQTQTRNFNSGTVPVIPAHSDISTWKLDYLKASDPDAITFNPTDAADFLVRMLAKATGEDIIWVLDQYQKAETQIQFAVDDRVDIISKFQQASNDGNAKSQYLYGMLLRRRAQDPDALASSTKWLRRSAEQGYPAAMAEYGYAIGLGLGVPAEPRLALIWIEKAESLSNPRARELAGTFRALVSE